MVRLKKYSNLVDCVDFSYLSGAIHWSVYKFFRINNRPKMLVCPVPKIFQVMMKWCRRASHLGRFIILCGTTTAETFAGKLSALKDSANTDR